MESDGVFRDVGRHERDGVAGPEAASGETAGEAADHHRQLRVGVAAPGGSVDQGGAVGHAIGPPQDVLGDGDVGDVDIGKRTAVDDHADSRPRGGFPG